MSRRAALLLVAVVALVALAVVYRPWTGAPSTTSKTSKRETTQLEENPVVKYAQLKGLEDEVVRRLQPLGSDGCIDDLERKLVEELLSLPPQKRLSPGVLSDLENVARDGEVTESELALLEDRYVSPEPPKVSGLRYEATDVRNEKVYEVTVTFSAEDSKTRVAKARLQWIPVRYEHLPREAFPEEKELIYELEPVDGSFDSPREEFVVRVSGFAGGREYVVRVEVWDEAGNKATAELRTEYFREFENVARLDDVLVGAYYYPWYGSCGKHWEEGYKGRPLLGEYDSQDPVVICRHIDWATGHGIDFFLVSWWGPSTYEDDVFKECLLKSQLAGSIKFAVLYETLGRLEHELRDGKLVIPLSLSNIEILEEDLEYLEANYFDHPSYLKLEGRPVVMLYLARCLEGDPRVLEALRERVYLLGDLVYWHRPDPGFIKAFDGITAYNMHVNTSEVLEEFDKLLLGKYGEWAKAAEKADVDFVPSALPGFDDSAIGRGNLPLPRSVDLFRERLRIAFRYAGKRGVVLVTSFNEWHEYTSVEPSREYGYSYLETILEELRTQKVFREIDRGISPPLACTSVGGRIAGFALACWGCSDSRSVEREYTEALARIRELNANYVAVLAFLHQDRRGSSEVYLREGEARVTRSIAVTAKEMGLRVMLYVFLLVEDGTWRGEIEPANVTWWFETYTRGVVEYAKMAAELGADGLLIGSELSTMEKYSKEWEKLIKRVREVYDGPLIYGVNWCCKSCLRGDFKELDWLSDLDYVGVDAYYPITSKARPSVADALRGWHCNPDGVNIIEELMCIHSVTERPLLLTEIGYRSHSRALERPWECGGIVEYDDITQAVGFQACFEALSDKPWVKGFIAWVWDVGYESRPGDTGFNVYGKPAQYVIAEWYRVLGRELKG